MVQGAEAAFRPDLTRDLRDVLLAQQALLSGNGSAAVATGSRHVENLAGDILAVVQSEIDTQVEWRVQQAVARLRVEGFGSPGVDTAERTRAAAVSVPTLIFSIPIIAIASGTAGFAGLALALVALVMINLTWATGWKPGRRRT